MLNEGQFNITKVNLLTVTHLLHYIAIKSQSNHDKIRWKGLRLLNRYVTTFL